MADKDYLYQVYADDLTPYGPAGKENLDVTRLTYDFTCWLDVGETLSEVFFPNVQLYTDVSNNWRVDYPLPDPAPAEMPDTYPMQVISEAITNLGTSAEIKVVAGTPSLSYVVSFVVVGSTTRRRKQVDTIINLEQLINSAMVGPGDLNPDVVPPILINGTTALPMGFDGWVILNNSSNSPGIVITLPPTPVLGQMVGFIDALGKDAAYPVTFRADGDGPIDGDGSTAFVSEIAYDVLQWYWTGLNGWHLQSTRYGFLGA